MYLHAWGTRRKEAAIASTATIVSFWFVAFSSTGVNVEDKKCVVTAYRKGYEAKF